jgi:hypothetical protein
MNKIKKYIMATSLVASLGACQSFVENYDVSPNSALTAPLELKMTSVFAMSGLVYAGELPRIANIWSGVFTGEDRQYVALNDYITSSGDFDNGWTNIYHLIITQSRLTAAEAAKRKDTYTQGKMQFMEAMTVGMTSSLWGDIPYSQITGIEKFPNPKYDAQADVYAAVQNKLDSAITNLSKAGGTLSGRDVFFQGANEKWVAAAYTLKARFFLHTKNYQAAISNAQKGIQAGNDMNFKFPGTTPGLDWNPYYDFLAYNRTGYMGISDSYAVELLSLRTGKTNEQGRMTYFFTDGTSLNIGQGGAYARDASFPYVTFSENQLILAEAQLRMGSALAALTALNSVRSNNAITYKSTYDNYVTQDFADNEALLKEIMTEKYLSLIGQIEVFSDVRRAKKLSGTGMVLDIPIRDGNKLPQRFLIPQIEIVTNKSLPSKLPDLFEETPLNK